MNVLSALRIVGFAVAASTFVVPWVAPGLAAAPLRALRRIALALGLVAQVGLTARAVARDGAPWTKLLLPLIATLAALEATFAGTFPRWAVLVGAVEAALVTTAVLRARRATRALDPNDFQSALAAHFARFVDDVPARWFALEVTIVLAAMRFLCGGFRDVPRDGFPYVRSSDARLLLVVPFVAILPEAIVVDLLVPAGAWGWRVASGAAHLYAMLWCVGAYATFRDRPHRVGASHVRFSCGALQTVEIERTNIVAATVRTILDARAWQRAHADGCSLAVLGAPAVELELATPLAVGGLRGTRVVRRLAVSADRPHDLVRALVT